VRKVEVERELLADLSDVWAFVSEPYHLPDWWPGIAGVEPDRRGLAPGARWKVLGRGQGGFRRADAEQLLLVQEVESPTRFAFHLTRDRLDAELVLAAQAPGRTLARLTVRGTWRGGLRHSLARTALSRLQDLCQTAASLGDAAV
jgi:uncharacterized protein YndB with AHSA1/START domain